MTKAEFNKNVTPFLDPIYTLKDFPKITYRTINYWDEAGFLLRKRRKTDRGWRRFSLIEFLWIKLLDEIRVLNINIDSTVPLLFDSVGFSDKSGKKAIEAAQLNFLSIISASISEKQKINLLVYVDKAEFLSEEKLRVKTSSSFENFVCISINKLLIDFVMLQEKERIFNSPLLTANESEMLALLIKEDILEITVSLGNKRIRIDCSKGKEEPFLKKVIETIYNPYTEITYKTKGGKTVRIENV